MISLKVNGKAHNLDISPHMSLLWAIRGHLKLTGTKYGCGKGLCGACTVHVDGKAVRSCRTRVGDVQGKKITSIEGIPQSHPLKKAWVKERSRPVWAQSASGTPCGGRDRSAGS